MRTVLRLLLFPIVLLAALSTVYLWALTSAFASPDHLKTVLVSNRTYDRVATLIEQKLKDSENGGSTIPIPAAVIKVVTESLIDQTAAYATGKVETPPSLSLEQIVAGAQGGSQLMAQLKVLQKEFSQSLSETDASRLSSEERSTITALNDVVNSQGTISLGSQVTWIRTTVRFVQVGLPVSIIVFIVSVVCILLVCPTNKNRVSWIAFIAFVLAGMFGVGAIFGFIPQIIFRAVPVSETSALIQSIASGILLPLIDVLYRYHVVAMTVFLCIGLIALLARIMLFKGTQTTVTVVPQGARKENRKVKRV